jgi:hypothetical protein
LSTISSRVGCLREAEALDGELVVDHSEITARPRGVDRRRKGGEVHRAMLGAGPPSTGRDTQSSDFRSADRSPDCRGLLAPWMQRPRTCWSPEDDHCTDR